MTAPGLAPRRRRWLAVVAATCLLVTAAGACSGGDADAIPDPTEAADGPGTTSGPGATTTTAARPSPPERFTGSVEDFYVVPDPLPPGEPGDLIRVQPVEAPPGEAGLRIMYRSTDGDGEPRAVTGVVYHPTDPPPDGGWPVLASAHGTTGIAPSCAPSRFPSPPEAYGVTGVRVATDYIGLGPVGELHSYLSAAAEGNAVIDAVRAVHQIGEANAGDRWLLVGHSQGGHAALVTHEMAAEALPEHELLGTVAIAPGAQFTERYGDDVQTRIITTMVLFGAAAEDPELDPADYLDAEAVAAAAEVVGDACLQTIIETMLPFAASPDFYVKDPLEDGLARTWMEENDPGRGASPSPLLLVSGGRDAIVVPARTEALYERLCELGQVVQFVDLPEATHDTEPVEAAGEIATWLADRLAGEPAPDTCA